MAIPENQLKLWAQLGTVKGAKNTHAAIRNALGRHQWPDDVRYVTYLQGSYRNNTHLRRQSDVDVVVELTSLPVRDGSLLPDSQKRLLDRDFPEPDYGWRRFRRDVRSAIAGVFGDSRVRAGNALRSVVYPSLSRRQRRPRAQGVAAGSPPGLSPFGIRKPTPGSVKM
jgi:hypothetical protein